MDDGLVNVEAERAVVGSILLDGPRVLPLVMDRYGLDVGSFSDPGCAAVFAAALTMADGQKLAGLDILTVAAAMKQAKSFERAGGHLFIEGLVDQTPTSAHADYYADIVRQKWMLRRVHDECKLVAVEAREAENGEAFAQGLPERFASVFVAREDEQSNLDVVREQVKTWRDAAEGGMPAIGLPTPWEKLTKIMCGVEDGMTIIAGRPSAGKSTLEDELSTHWAMDGLPVARVQLDMNRKKSLARAVCRLAGVSLPKLKFGYGRKDQLAKVDEVAATVGELPMFINDKAYSLRQICSWARMMKLKHDVKVLTVDHIQLVQVDSGISKGANDNVRVGYVSSTLKALGAELDTKLVVLSQLSRGFDKESRPPRLSDLRDSGTLEQDAAKVLFVYPEYHKKLLEELETTSRRPVWMNLVKNQDGETGILPFWLWKKYFRFEFCQASDHEEEVRMMGNPIEDDDVEV